MFVILYISVGNMQPHLFHNNMIYCQRFRKRAQKMLLPFFFHFSKKLRFMWCMHHHHVRKHWQTKRYTYMKEGRQLHNLAKQTTTRNTRQYQLCIDEWCICICFRFVFACMVNQQNIFILGEGVLYCSIDRRAC